jgi:hypothetical protein
MVKVANLEGAGGFTVSCKPADPTSVTFPGSIAIPPSLMSGALGPGLFRVQAL